MSKRLQITLDEEATQKYLEWASAILEAEVDEDCEPCGCSITVEIGGPYGSPVFGNTDEGHLEFGDADVGFI